MNNIINIGIPSKGRLKKKFLKIFKNKKLKLISERGERDLIGSVQGKKNIKILYLHAREIIQRLGDGSLDLGFSGFDLFKESEFNIQKKINVIKKYDFGKANLVIATKYPNLTRNFLYSKGVTQFQLVASSGAMEVYPFTGSANLISDVSSSGETIKSNNLRILKDGIILKSQACFFISKKNKSKMDIKKTIRLFT